MKVKGRSFDVRVSTLPVIHGESLVMRLLDQCGGIAGLKRSGCPVMHCAIALLRSRRCPTA